MPSTAEYRVHGIANGTFEPIAVELAIVLYVADCRFDRAAAMNHLPDCACNPAPLTRAPNGYAIDLGTAVAAVDNHHLRLDVTKNVRLLQRLMYGIAVKRDCPEWILNRAPFLLSTASRSTPSRRSRGACAPCPWRCIQPPVRARNRPCFCL